LICLQKILEFLYTSVVLKLTSTFIRALHAGTTFSKPHADLITRLQRKRGAIKHCNVLL
jgi:hypothetical protein